MMLGLKSQRPELANWAPSGTWRLALGAWGFGEVEEGPSHRALRIAGHGWRGTLKRFDMFQYVSNMILGCAGTFLHGAGFQCPGVAGRT